MRCGNYRACSHSWKLVLYCEATYIILFCRPLVANWMPYNRFSCLIDPITRVTHICNFINIVWLSDWWKTVLISSWTSSWFDFLFSFITASANFVHPNSVKTRMVHVSKNIVNAFFSHFRAHSHTHTHADTLSSNHSVADRLEIVIVVLVAASFFFGIIAQDHFTWWAALAPLCYINWIAIRVIYGNLKPMPLNWWYTLYSRTSINRQFCSPTFFSLGNWTEFL